MTIPSRMSALVMKEDGYAAVPSSFSLEALEPYVDLASVEVPQPGPGQVLIRLAAAAVNPSDVLFIKGLYGRPRQKGKAAGIEGAGEVVALGEGADRGLLGKRVSFSASANGTGTWAQYAVADAVGCIPLRDDLRDEDAAGLIVNPITALAMFGIVRAEGAKAFVVTAGGSQLCKLLIRAASDEGYRPIAIVRRDGQIAHLENLGATHVLNSESPDYAERLADVIKSEKPRIFLDAVTGPVAARIFTLMPSGGRWIVYGRLDQRRPEIEEPGQFIFMNKRIEGFWLSQWMGQAAPAERVAVIQQAQARFASRAWVTDVTATIALADAARDLPAALAVPDGKVFLKPD